MDRRTQDKFETRHVPKHSFASFFVSEVGQDRQTAGTLSPNQNPAITPNDRRVCLTQSEHHKDTPTNAFLRRVVTSYPLDQSYMFTGFMTHVLRTRYLSPMGVPFAKTPPLLIVVVEGEKRNAKPAKRRDCFFVVL